MFLRFQRIHIMPRDFRWAHSSLPPHFGPFPSAMHFCSCFTIAATSRSRLAREAFKERLNFFEADFRFVDFSDRSIDFGFISERHHLLAEALDGSRDCESFSFETFRAGHLTSSAVFLYNTNNEARGTVPGKEIEDERCVLRSSC